LRELADNTPIGKDMKNVKLDEIGYWSEVKLDIVRKYAGAYSTIMNAQPTIQSYIYIDAFAGAGVHMSKATGEYVLGSPLNALNIQPSFKEFHFIDLDGGRAKSLRKLCTEFANVRVYEGDCNKLLIEKIFPSAKYSDYRRALCLLDPYGLHLDWKVLYAAGQMKSIEIFLNFPVMDMNMNVLWRNRQKVPAAQKARMDTFWGDDTWSFAVYKSTQGLFNDIEEKSTNRDIAKAFQQRLHDVAGFAYVPAPIPMRNSTGSVVYYLFFASPNKTGAKIVQDIFDEYRDKGTT
jgi:three-Cys-motif partner protein